MLYTNIDNDDNGRVDSAAVETTQVHEILCETGGSDVTAFQVNIIMLENVVVHTIKKYSSTK